MLEELGFAEKHDMYQFNFSPLPEDADQAIEKIKRMQELVDMLAKIEGQFEVLVNYMDRLSEQEQAILESTSPTAEDFKKLDEIQHQHEGLQRKREELLEQYNMLMREAESLEPGQLRKELLN